MAVRWGIMGTGWIAGSAIAPAIRASESGELLACLSRDKAAGQAFCAQHGCSRAYDRMEDFLADDEIEAVYIATPNAQHAGETVACAGAGKHILCDKPMATSAADCRRMIEACQQAGVNLMVAYQNRFHPCHQEARRLVQSGELGEPRIARAQFYFKYPGPPSDWRQQVASAGGWATMDVGTHALDLLRFLLGDEVAEVFAFVDNPGFSYETEDVAVLSLRFRNRTLAWMDCATSVHTPHSHVEVYASNGSVELLGTLGKGGSGTLQTVINGHERSFEYASVQLYVAEIEEFNRSILEERTPAIPGGEGLRNLEILDAAFLSARERRTVQL